MPSTKRTNPGSGALGHRDSVLMVALIAHDEPGSMTGASWRAAAVSTHTKEANSSSARSVIRQAPCDQGFHTIVVGEPVPLTVMARS